MQSNTQNPIATPSRVRGTTDLERLYAEYQALSQAEPALRARDLAQRLYVSEAELVACRQGCGSERLRPEFELLLKSLEPLGEVMVLTRNQQAVHERRGIYRNVTFSREGRMGLVLADEIDLRLFMSHWHSVFHLEEKGRQSLQFFDSQGGAIHKIYATENTDMEAWQALVMRFLDPQPGPLELLAPTPTPAKDLQAPPAGFDREAFRRDWAALRDVHEYHRLLRKHGLTRTLALREIGDKWSTELTPTSLADALRLAAEREQEIMVFVGNSACIQIHTGPVSRLLETGPWFNVLDSRFNLHLRLDQVAEVWAITRPTNDGIVTSIEGFNAHGESVITLFGKRKPGQAELQGWREIVADLRQTATREPRSCA